MRNLALSLLILGGVATAAGTRPQPAGYVHVIQITGPITKATADMVETGFETAKTDHAGLILIEIDTPGGLVEATRDIVESILNSELPVVVYVTPRGAHAASAGTFITLAGHVAAMAPGTQIGAAHPIGIGPPDFSPEPTPSETGTPTATPVGSPSPGVSPAASPAATPAATPDAKKDVGAEGGAKKLFPFRFRSDQEHLAQKLENDTVAWIEGIATLRGRNVEWARQAVLQSVSITAEEAVKINVVDLIAADRQDLLSQINGRQVETASGTTITLDTIGIQTFVQRVTSGQRIVGVLSSPMVLIGLVIIMLLGFFIEFKSPGLIFPAIIAVLSLIAFLVGASLISLNIGGLLLIVGAFVLFFLEIKVVSYGLLTAAGVVCLVGGAYLLVDQTTYDAPAINWLIMGPFMGAVVFIVVLLSTLVIRSQRSGRAADLSDMVGEFGEATTDIGQSGKVRVLGAYWSAESTQPIAAGQRIRVTGVEGLRLTVEPASPKTPSATE